MKRKLRRELGPCVIFASCKQLNCWEIIISHTLLLTMFGPSFPESVIQYWRTRLPDLPYEFFVWWINLAGWWASGGSQDKSASDAHCRWGNVAEMEKDGSAANGIRVSWHLLSGFVVIVIFKTGNFGVLKICWFNTMAVIAGTNNTWYQTRNLFTRRFLI